MKSTETMTNEELYNTAACDYDSIYLSQVRIVYSDYHTTDIYHVAYKRLRIWTAKQSFPFLNSLFVSPQRLAEMFVQCRQTLYM